MAGPQKQSYERTASDELEEAPFLPSEAGQDHRRRWPLLDGILLVALLISMVLNVATILSNHHQDLDDVCSVYTSQSGNVPQALPAICTGV